MYTTIISLRITPDKMDQAVRIYRSSILPELKKQSGLASALVFSCRQKNELIACTLWLSYEEMMEMERTGGVMDQQIAKLSGVLAEPAEGDHYELEIIS
jgi:hypothetical protein